MGRMTNNDRRSASFERAIAGLDREGRRAHAQLQDARELNPDPCPRSKFGRHRYDEKLINACGEPICDFCHQTKAHQ